MGAREELLRRIEKKRAEIAEDKRQFETRMTGEERYLQAMLDMYKFLPRSGDEANGSGERQSGLRAGSMPSKAYDALKRHGSPMHIKELVTAIGMKQTRKTKQGLASSLRAYVLKGELFTKPAPNTYGLVEFGTKPQPVSLVDFGEPEEPDEEDA